MEEVSKYYMLKIKWTDTYNIFEIVQSERKVYGHAPCHIIIDAPIEVVTERLSSKFEDEF